MNIADADSFIPITPQTLYLLMALADQPCNGYEMARRVKIMSDTKVEMGWSGGLYKALQRLETGLAIEVASTHPASGPSGESKVYRLTSTGRLILEAELKRYAAAIKTYRAIAS